MRSITAKTAVFFLFISLLTLFVTVGAALLGPNQPIPKQETLVHQGKPRHYYLFTPSGYQPGHAMPLVLVFHGYLGSATQMMRMTDFNEMAEKEGFLVAYADALGKWRAKTGPSEMNAEDVTFVQAMLKEIEQKRNVDAKRVYATGFSNGGFFTQRLACEMSDQIAAFATVASTIGIPLKESCSPARPVPILMINGTDDTVVTWRGKIKKVRYAFRDAKITSVPQMADFWRKLDGCSDTPGQTLIIHANPADQGAKMNLYQDCHLPAEVEQIIIEGGGHTWPGSRQQFRIGRLFLGRISQDVHASDEIWSFFSRHPIP